MQFVRATSTAALFLLLGTIVPVYAQHDKENGKQGKPEKQQGRQAQPARQQRPQGKAQQPQARAQQQQKQPQAQRHAQPARQPQQQQQVQRTQQQRPQQQQVRQTQQRQSQRPQQQQARQQQQPHRTRQQAAAWQQQRGWLHQGGGWQEHSTWQQNRAQRWESEHRSWAQRGGYGGYYIPQARFSLYFGSQHWFRMHRRPTIYMGYPRFSYGGFSFLLVDPWPEYWAENWYDADDVYVDYDNGYYLYNRRHPGIGLAITVIM